MLYIMSQSRMRIADLHTVSIVTPEHDRSDEGVYKVFVNGMEFAKYETGKQAEEIIPMIQRFIQYSGHDNACFKLPQEL